MLSQLLVLFGFFALVLVSVYWVNRAVILFDRLIADGHSAGVFLEFTALSLPKVIGMVMPMAAFAAAVYVTNKLSSESELTVVQATGFSPWRIARPMLIFGVLLALGMSIITHFLIPASLSQLRMREVEISGSISARLLREGVFLHPTNGVTFYIGDITAEGELVNVFLSDRRSDQRAITYTAERGFLLRDDDGPKLVMLQGMAQNYDLDTQRMSTTTFSDFTYDISAFIKSDNGLVRRIEHVSTWALLTRPDEIAAETLAPLAHIAEEAHSRFQQPLLCIVAALIGFSALMVGGFSRFGVGRQIIGSIFLLVIIKLVESAVTEPARSNVELWPLVYVPTLVGFVISGTLLHLAARPFRRRRAPVHEVKA
jgi:lipopolysaccharide export system permease protein